MSRPRNPPMAVTFPFVIRCMTVALAIFGVCPRALAGNGNAMPSFVLGNPTSLSAIRVSVDMRWVDGPGYRPIRVTAETANKNPMPSDRQITIELKGRPSYNRARVSFQSTITFPEGATRISEILYVPSNADRESQRYADFRLNVRVGRGGAGNAREMTIGFNSHDHGDNTPRYLFVDSDVPRIYDTRTQTNGIAIQAQDPDVLDVSGVIRGIPGQTSQDEAIMRRWPANRRWQAINSDIPNCQMLSLEDLPPSYLGLTSVDFICLALDDLLRLHKEHPAQWTALSNWTRNGGNLWICGGGEKFERLDEVANLFQLPHKETRGTGQWQTAQPTALNNDIDAFDSESSAYSYNAFALSEPDDSDNPTATELVKPVRMDPVRIHNLQLGSVCVFALEDAFEEDNPSYWSWIYHTLKTNRCLWTERNGLSKTYANRSFWRFLIPGVGLAPVKSYAVLLTLFVIGIGPVSFVVLRRWKRLNWLMFSVPLGALLVTSALACYAMLTDGISMRGRSRTITHIDQRSNHEVTWSRQAYYAALPPGDGLNFGTRTIVYPIDFAPDSGHVPPRQIYWGDTQNLRRGYLGSRSTSQFLVQRSRPTKAGITIPSIDPEAPETETLSVTNHLGEEIAELYVQTDSGTVFHGTRIPSEGEATLQKFSSAQFRARMLELNAFHMMQPPEGVDPDDIQISGRSGYYYSYRRGSRRRFDATESAAENSLNDLNATQRYVAVMKQPVNIPTGKENVRWKKTIHIILGEW